MLGGNLALVVSTIGTHFMPSLRNTVLLLEEVDEYPHRVDRMFAQLRNSGVLQNAAAIVFGRFTECGPKDPGQPHLTVEQLLKEYGQFARGPVLGNFCYGHVPKKLTVPFGLHASIDTRKRRIEVREGAVI